MQKYVVGFLFDTDKANVALIKKTRPAWQAGKLNGIGGKIEDTDASPAEAMSREFFEETGVRIAALGWDNFGKLVGIRDGRKTAEIWLFRAVGNHELLTTTDEVPDWYPAFGEPFATYLHRMVPNLAFLVPAARNSEVAWLELQIDAAD